VEQVYAEQIAACRQDYEQQINKLNKRIKELEDWNEDHHQGTIICFVFFIYSRLFCFV